MTPNKWAVAQPTHNHRHHLHAATPIQHTHHPQPPLPLNTLLHKQTPIYNTLNSTAQCIPHKDTTTKHRAGNGQASPNLLHTISRRSHILHSLHRNGPSHRRCLTHNATHNTDRHLTSPTIWDNTPRHHLATTSQIRMFQDLIVNPAQTHLPPGTVSPQNP